MGEEGRIWEQSGALEVEGLGLGQISLTESPPGFRLYEDSFEVLILRETKHSKRQNPLSEHVTGDQAQWSATLLQDFWGANGTRERS